MVKTDLLLLISLSTFQPLYSQQDSPVDVFPLAVGNQWTYSYTKNIDDHGNECWSTDSGSAFFEVRNRIVTPDSTRWMLQQRRDVVHSWRCLSGSGSVNVVDSVTFELIEQHAGQHQLYLFGSAYSNSGEVFPFTREFTDTTTILRFRSVDSSGVVKFQSGVPGPFPNSSIWGLFTFEAGRGLVSVTCRGAITGAIRYGNHTLVNSQIVGVSEEGTSRNEPSNITLLQNYPNPFNPATTIEYTLPHEAGVSLKLFDVLGREIMTLVEATQERGAHRVTFNADNLTSGIYFYRLRTGDFIATRKLLYLR